jgi:hypothetical protein
MFNKKNQKIIILLVILAVIYYYQNKKERFETEQKGIIRYKKGLTDCDLILSNNKLSFKCTNAQSTNIGNNTNTFIITPENRLKNINSQYIYVSDDYRYILDSNISEIINREGVSYYPLKKILNESKLSFNNKILSMQNNSISTSGGINTYKFVEVRII